MSAHIMSFRRKNTAFTLIELLVATLIVSIGVVSILTAFQANINALGRTRYIMTSVADAKNLIARCELSSINGQPPDVAGISLNGPIAAAGKQELYEATIDPSAAKSTRIENIEDTCILKKFIIVTKSEKKSND